MEPKGKQSAMEFYGVVEEETFDSTPEEIALIQEGLKSVDDGRVRDFGEVMGELRKKHGIKPTDAPDT